MIYNIVNPYFEFSLKNRKTIVEIPLEVEILATKNTFVRSKGIGKFRFPVIKHEEQVNLYVKTKQNIYKTRYSKPLGDKLKEVLLVKNVTGKRINFDISKIENFKMLYSNSNEISELLINDKAIKSFNEKKITRLKVIPVLIITLFLSIFIFLLVFLWNEP